MRTSSFRTGRAALLALALSLPSSASWAVPVAVDRETAMARLAAARQGIDVARALLRGDAASRGRADALLAQVALELVAAERQIVTSAPSPLGAMTVDMPYLDESGEVVPAVAAVPMVVIETRSFARLLDRMSREPFDSDKIRVLREGLGGSALTSGHLVAVLGQIKFGDKRLAALELCATHLIDRPTRSDLEPLFSLIGEMEKAQKLLGGP